MIKTNNELMDPQYCICLPKDLKIYYLACSAYIIIYLTRLTEKQNCLLTSVLDDYWLLRYISCGYTIKKTSLMAN